MPGWTLVDAHPTQGRTFKRPLHASELCFFWDCLFNGTSDTMHHYVLRLLNGPRDAHLFSEANIVKAWLSTKRRHPLSGATVKSASGGPLDVKIVPDTKAEGGTDGIEFTSEPHFVVREHDLSVLRPREIIFGQVSGTEEAQQRVGAILDGPRPLSDELLVQLYVFRETGRTDVLHLVSMAAHCISDGTANRGFVRCLLDSLARGGESDSEPAQVPLEDRLAMLVPSLELEPVHLRSLSPARRRWRRAIGIVIFRSRIAKRQGGHTLPCRIMRSTPQTPARSGYTSTMLPPTESTIVIANCRMHGITFGSAFLALAQVAMTRVLYRRYLRGEISEEEWEYRKRQPHMTAGPLNLRSHLNKEWFEKGGGGEFMESMGVFFYQLPFMTLGSMVGRERDQEHALSDGAPPFSDLLPFNRFLHHAGLVKKQAMAFFSHPLFLEIAYVTSLFFLERRKLTAMRWIERGRSANGVNAHGNADKDEVLVVKDMPMVYAHGGSSTGNIELMCPSEYPLPPTHPLSPYSPVPHPLKAGHVAPTADSLSACGADTAPQVVVEYARTRLHARPAELYLGAATWRGQMIMHIFYDSNVYEDGVVREWLDEVREAVLWYLGQTHARQ